MAPPGREVLLGVNRDPTWGLLLMIGLGGVLVEVLGDVVLAPVPLDQTAARALIHRLVGAQAFAPFRGMPAADTEALGDLIVRLCILPQIIATISMRSISTRSSSTHRVKASLWWMR